MLVRAAAAEVYYLAMTTATIVSTLGLAGIGCAALRTVAAYASSGMWDDVRRGNRAVYLSHAAPWIGPRAEAPTYGSPGDHVF